MCILIPLSDVTTVCPVFKDKTGDSLALKGICCMMSTARDVQIATGVECEGTKRDKRLRDVV